MPEHSEVSVASVAPVALESPVTLASLAAEVARLTARVAELERRAAVVLERSGEVVAAPAADAAGAEPAVAVTEPLAAAEVAPFASGAPAHRPDDPAGEIKALLTAVFAVALQTDDGNHDKMTEHFDSFGELVHHARRGSPLLRQELFAYKWRPLCGRVKGYLADPGDPSSFTIVQQQPSRVDAKTETVKLFLKADKRMPPPVTLRRDETAGGAFRLEASSL